MRNERSIDSNACICLDGRNNEAAVFGRGIGSVCPPQNLPSGLIGRAFPEAASSEIGLLQSILEESDVHYADEADMASHLRGNKAEPRARAGRPYRTRAQAL